MPECGPSCREASENIAISGNALFFSFVLDFLLTAKNSLEVKGALKRGLVHKQVKQRV